MPDARTALIVDDDENIRALLCAILGRAGYRVRAFGGPYPALVAAQQSPPDIYVLDVRLPDMSGRDLCRVLKAVERTRRPVLMISAESSGSDLVEAFAAGCDDFLAKPFRRVELIERIDGLLVGV